MRTQRRLIRAAMVVDAESVADAPGALLIDGDDDVIAAGSPQSIGSMADAEVIDLPQSVILPAFVNVHTHLDLTHLGCWDRPTAFIDWVRRVRAGRAIDDAGIAASSGGGSRCGARAGSPSWVISQGCFRACPKPLSRWSKAITSTR